VNIADNEVGLLLNGLRQPIFSVAGRSCDVPERTEQIEHQVKISGVIFYDKNS